MPTSTFPYKGVENMFSHYAFVDESGNYGFKFDKENVSKYFIITAIIVEKDKLKILEKEIGEIRERFFQTGEMKSSSVKNLRRRKDIIKLITKSDFSIYSLVVDKRKINIDGGLGYHGSFYKYLNRQLYEDLFLAIPNLHVTADKYGDKQFMKGFKKYIKNKPLRNIFSDSSFEFASSKKRILLQLADMISGTIFQQYENKANEKYQEIYNLLLKKVNRIENWPTFTVNPQQDSHGGLEYDQVISDLAIQLSTRYISNNKYRENRVIKDRVNFLKFLRTNLFINQNKYVATEEIINNLNSFSDEVISIDYLRSNIVAPLRDEDILISSSNNQHGYKLPISARDLLDFVKLSSSNVLPMLRRLEKCRKSVLLATNNNLDILAGEQFKELKEFFDVKYQRQ